MQSSEAVLEGVLELRAYREAMYQSHAAYHLERWLEPWSLRVLCRVDLPKRDDDQVSVVVVDDRPSCQLRFCILNALLMGRLRMVVQLFTTRSKIREMRRLFRDLEPWVEVLQLDDSITEIGRESYNRLLKTAAFWGRVCSERILVIQQDALLIEPVDFSFFDYDYIGSPWSQGKHVSVFFPVYSSDLRMETGARWETVVFSPALGGGPLVGNGGFSARSRSCMIAISSGEASEEDEPEDCFFAKHVDRYASRFPTMERARRFSCETHYSLSIGAHASYLYLDAEQQAEIYERHHKNVVALVKASIGS